MPKAGSPKRYAQAAFDLARSRNELDRWRDDLRLIVQALSQPEFQALMQVPKVHVSRKLELVKVALGGVHPLVLNLANLLVVKGRVHLAAAIATEFEQLVDLQRGIERAEVVTVIELDQQDQERVRQVLAGVVQKDLRLFTRTDPAILGGLVAKVGDKVIDGSARGRLEQLKRELVRAGDGARLSQKGS